MSDPRTTQLSGVVAALFDAITEVAEAAHNTRWHQDAEFHTWRLMGDGRARWGRVDRAAVRPALVTACLLAQQSGLWLTWPPDATEPQPIDLATWRARYGEWDDARRRNRRRRRK